MKCNKCGFTTPPPDPISVVIMQAHLDECYKGEK